MGLLSWLFPKPQDRVEKAKRLIQDERYAEARLEIIDVDLDEAKTLLRDAEMALVRLNIERAIQKARAGDFQQYESHIELARSFDHFDQTALFEAAAEQLADIMGQQAVTKSWDTLDHAAERRARLGTDPGDFTLDAYAGTGVVRLFFGEERPFNLPGLQLEPMASWFKPTWCITTESNALMTGLKSAYPEQLHPAIDQAGDGLADALAYYHQEAPEKAVQTLRTMPLSNPVIAFELGRAASALGQHEAAILAFDEAYEQTQSDFEVDGISVRIFQAAAALWNKDLSTAEHMLDQATESARAGVPHLVAVIAIETGQTNLAEDALARIADDDLERPQLAGALELRVALKDALEAYPILTDEEAQGTAEWNQALEVVFEQLRTKVDEVLENLRAHAANEPDDEEHSDTEDE
ncbi:MAG: hypothetical protein VX589_10590 [Myxococcota bacterium]|nr:hypothetical protein [Myxococcota bacterium]